MTERRPDPSDADRVLERLLDDVVRATEAIEPPPHLVARIEARLADEDAKRARRMRFRRGGVIGILTAAASIAIGLAIWVRFTPTAPIPASPEDTVAVAPTSDEPAPSAPVPVEVVHETVVEPAEGWFAETLETRNPRISIVIIHRDYRAPLDDEPGAAVPTPPMPQPGADA